MKSETFEEVMSRRLGRRNFLKGAAGTLVLSTVPAAFSAPADQLNFQPIALNTADTVSVPNGYFSRVLLRWGDPLFAGAAGLDLANQTPESQSRQFGYNCDFVGFFPFVVTPFGSINPFNPVVSPWTQFSAAGLLAVNHEYTDPGLMFPTYNANAPTRNDVDIELAAHGVSVVEIYTHYARGWGYNQNSAFNRRFTGETEMRLTGPAAGHDLLKTTADTTGTLVKGTLNNCGGGKTPWGTLLTAEENFNQYFGNNNGLPASDRRKAIHTRYGVTTGATSKKWELHHDRFDVVKEPNEPFRFGWIVEIDPYDPSSVPKKRTALGRTKHEAATTTVAPDGRVVVYLGDDERFDYMYKFVTSGKFDPANRRANMDLLDQGTLYAARFKDDGTGDWLPLAGGQGGALVSWPHQEVLINTRGAGDAIGATKMDRPEDIERNPMNGKVYCVMTNNTNRGAANQPATDAANPRANNRHGHIIEIAENGNDPTALTFRWEIFLIAGNPSVGADQTYYAGFDQSKVSAFSCPDNIAFDNRGNMWIATDGQPGTMVWNDSIFAVPVDGPDRGYVRPFLSGPKGSEICGPEFTPNNDTLFCAIQHPGEGGTLTQPVSTWPDGTNVARPSVIAVSKVTPRSVIGS